MTYNETMAIVYRVIGAYPFYTRHFSDEMVEDMIREWHEAMRGISRDGAMDAITALIMEQKWMPTLSEVITKILDMQYGEDGKIIQDLDKAIASSSTCIIFGEVTEEQERGYERLSDFQKLIVRSPNEFNLWLTRDHEWKQDRVSRVKRDVQYGRHTDYLNGNQQKLTEHANFNVFKALEERKNGQDQQ